MYKQSFERVPAEFFNLLHIAQILLWEGSAVHSRQLIFEKKFLKSKKKIHACIRITFECRVTGPDMFLDYFLVF